MNHAKVEDEEDEEKKKLPKAANTIREFNYKTTNYY